MPTPFSPEQIAEIKVRFQPVLDAIATQADEEAQRVLAAEAVTAANNAEFATNDAANAAVLLAQQKASDDNAAAAAVTAAANIELVRETTERDAATANIETAFNAFMSWATGAPYPPTTPAP